MPVGSVSDEREAGYWGSGDLSTSEDAEASAWSEGWDGNGGDDGGCYGVCGGDGF